MHIAASLLSAAVDQPLLSGSDALGAAVASLYSYSLKIVGLAVFIMFLIAGLSYIVPDRFKWGPLKEDPIKIIQDAVIGLILLFAAYLILNTINPDLVTPQKAPTAPAASAGGGSSTGASGLPTSSNAPFVPGGGSFGGGGASGTF